MVCKTIILQFKSGRRLQPSCRRCGFDTHLALVVMMKRFCRTLGPFLWMTLLISPRIVGATNLPGLLVTTDWVEKNLATITVIDVRPRAEYVSAHVPGAVNVHWKSFSDPKAPFPGNLDPETARLARGLGKLGISSDVPVVIYANPLGNWGEEGRMFWTLELLGHAQVAVMDGGWPLWRSERRSVQSGTVTAPEARFTPRLRPERRIDVSELARRLSDPALVRLDTRSAAEYAGKTPYGEVRGGRIPGAKHLDWQSFLESSGRFKSRTKMLALIEPFALKPDTEVALYCTGGVRSGFVYFALRLLGFDRARNYDGSFWEWAARADLPVE